MAAYYIYLMASLPMLHFGTKAPFSYEKFLLMCKDLIPEKDIAMLEAIGRGDEHIYQHSFPTLREWSRFNTAVRNELVRIRAGHKHVDPAKYLRHEEYYDSSISHIAINAHRNPSILEAEGMLDAERCLALDEISAGHYFDVDILIAYAYKLLILEKWDMMRAADRQQLLLEAIRAS